MPVSGRTRSTRGSLVGFLATTLSLVLGGCSDGQDQPAAIGGDAWTGTPPPSGDVCASDKTATGCACATPGETIECGRVVKREGSYVTCSIGHERCVDGKWSECSGDRFLEKSLSSSSIFDAGSPYITGPCPNPCDPNPGCTGLTGVISDVDATVPVYPAPDGGLTLTPEDATPGVGPCKGTGLQCQVVACTGEAGTTTEFAGIVYDPAGKNPLYGATVYIPVDPTGTLPPFTQGVSCDTCGGAAALNAVNVTQTAPDGSFKFTNVPSGKNIPIIVQTGKWRREILIEEVKPCTGNSITNNCTATDKKLCMLRLPGSQTDGYNPAKAGGSLSTYNSADMPQIAMVSGAADPLECMLLKAGISVNEISSHDRDVGATTKHKLHFFESPNAPGSHLDSFYGTIQTSRSLWTDPLDPTTSASKTMPGSYGYYDVVLDACEGSAIDKKPLKVAGAGDPYADLIKYTGIGGRAFITHFGYVWMDYPSYKTPTIAPPENWSGVASWISHTGTRFTTDPLAVTLNTAFPKGLAFSNWLTAVGANPLYIHEGRKDLTTIGTNTQGWMTANSSGNYTPHFTFNTPYTAASKDQCGRVVYSDFHVSASALVSTASATCYDASDCGFGQTCSGSPGTAGTCSEPCTSNSDCKDGTYSCVGATAGTCQPTSCSPGTPSYACAVGTCNATHDACLCTQDAQCPSGKCVNSGQCAAGDCSGSGAKNSDNCQTDAPTACTGTTTNSCSSSKGTCSSGTGNCTMSATGTIAAPSAVCSDTTKGCNASGTKCVCKSDSQCGGPIAKCKNVSGSCPVAGSCTSTATGAQLDENNCEIPGPLPTPTTSGSATCPSAVNSSGTDTLGCTAGGKCRYCNSDSQCDGPSGESRYCENDDGCWYNHDSMGCCLDEQLGDDSTARNLNCPAGGACITSGSYSGKCACSTDAECGKFGNCGNIWESSTDWFACERNSPSSSNSYDSGRASACTGAGGSYVYYSGRWRCTCNSDAQCGANSKCFAITGSTCTAGTCTAAAAGWSYADTDRFQCTPRESPGTACTGPATYSCANGKPASGSAGGGKCLCTSDNQCGSRKCANWSGCAAGACTGAAGAGDPNNGCVVDCTGVTTTCGTFRGFATTYNAATNSCKCTNNAQCASGVCGGVGADASTGCQPATTYTSTCSVSSCPSGTSLQGSSCWCQNDNQCPTGLCVPWSVGVAGCTGPNCTGSGAFDANHCQTAPATCSSSTSYACSVGTNRDCDVAHNCRCTADAACATGTKCIDVGQCAAGACTGTGIADARGCSRPTPAIPTSCTTTIPYTCASGTCNAASTACICTSDTQCPSGICVNKESQCAAGACTGALTDSYDAAYCVTTATTCTTNAQCAGPGGLNVELCSGAAGSPPGLGQCTKACTTSAQCTGGETCTGGFCQGCTTNANCFDRTYPAKCIGGAGAVAGTCSGPGTRTGKTSKYFPAACENSPMTDQEKALEFMFFDLTACVNPDGVTPSTPSIKLEPVTFPLDFTSVCPIGTKVKWRELQFQSSFPSPVNGSSIVFSGQTTDAVIGSTPDFSAATNVSLATSTTNTVLPNWDVVLLDTAPGGTGRFTTATPAVTSGKYLRVNVTMTPTSDKLLSPTLLGWKVVYDCPAVE